MTESKICAIDFETYYDKRYSLSKMTNEQYVMGDEFDTLCVSIWMPEWSTRIEVPWGNIDTLRAAIMHYVPDLAERYVVAWNAKFDGSVLEWRLGLEAKGFICAMTMFGALYGMGSQVSLAKAAEFYELPAKGDEVLNMMGVRWDTATPEQRERYRLYCQHDTRLCIQIFYKLLEDGFPADEIPLVDATDKCYIRSPLVLNNELATTALINERTRHATILAALSVPATALRSNDQFADLLRAEGVEPPLKVSPSDPEKLIVAFAKTDEEFTDMQEHENPRVRALVSARLGVRSSIIETRLERLIDVASRGTIPIPINYSGARVTNRWAATKSEATNMQNSPRGSVIREVLCAPPGMKLVAVDLSGIELRVARWLAANWYKDTAAIETIKMIRDGVDLYCVTASKAYGRTVTKADKTERQAGKETELSCQFRVGHEKLNHRLRTTWGVYLDPGMDKVLVDTFRTTNKFGVVQAWKDLDLAIVEMAQGHTIDKFWPFVIEGNVVQRPSKLALWYPDLTYEPGKYGPQAVYFMTKGRRTEKGYLHGGSLFNNMVQSLSRDIMAYGWRLLLKQDPVFHPIMTVHDELISCVPVNRVEQCVQVMSDCMTTLPAWARKAPVIQLPLAVEANFGQNYKECK